MNLIIIIFFERSVECGIDWSCIIVLYCTEVLTITYSTFRGYKMFWGKTE